MNSNTFLTSPDRGGTQCSLFDLVASPEFKDVCYPNIRFSRIATVPRLAYSTILRPRASDQTDYFRIGKDRSVLRSENEPFFFFHKKKPSAIRCHITLRVKTNVFFYWLTYNVSAQQRQSGIMLQPWRTAPCVVAHGTRRKDNRIPLHHRLLQTVNDLYFMCRIGTGKSAPISQMFLCVGSVLYRPCTASHNDRLVSTWDRSWSIWSIWSIVIYLIYLIYLSDVCTAVVLCVVRTLSVFPTPQNKQGPMLLTAVIALFFEPSYVFRAGLRIRAQTLAHLGQMICMIYSRRSWSR